MSTTPTDPTAAFLAYAEAFEAGYASRDWKHVDERVTDDVVWSLDNLPPPMGGTHVGRKNVLEAIRQSTERFDRRFDHREPRILEGPREIPGGIHMTWAVTYRREGLEPFVLLGEEWDLFRDGRLSLHRESIHNMDEAWAYLGRHAASLLQGAPKQSPAAEAARMTKAEQTTKAEPSTKAKAAPSPKAEPSTKAEPSR
jgi:hypothetical protein